MDGIREFLEERKAQGLLRTLKPITSREDGKIVVGGQKYIDFSSNDYLGLSYHPRMIDAAKKALDAQGSSSAASRLLSGDLDLHHQLEERVAHFKKKEAGLVFNSGYQANLGIISALFGKGDCIFSDRLNHASIVDGMLLSVAKIFRFQHNDMEHLGSLLQKERKNFKKALIITETVFSMDGDICPLNKIVDLKNKYNCTLMVDEAHATGIFGKNGAGIVEEFGLEKEVDLVMGTFSKALGSFGAYLAASREIVDFLVNTCRSFIYSTALPPAVIAADIESIDIVRDEPLRRQRLLDSARYFRERLQKEGFRVEGQSQIVPFILGENEKAVIFSRKLQEKGFWVMPIRPPTVPKGNARLRFSFTYNHSREIVEKLIKDIIDVKT